MQLTHTVSQGGSVHGAGKCDDGWLKVDLDKPSNKNLTNEADIAESAYSHGSDAKSSAMITSIL